METKKHYRELVFRSREQMGEENNKKCSLIIQEKILSLPVYKEKNCIYAYVDFNREVRTHELLKRALEEGKKVCVPRIQNHSMVFIRLTDFSQLGKGYYGIMEPMGEEVVEDEDALMLMPGVAFDRQLHRIGYGGGYYDRYLEGHKDIVKLALAFDFQVFPEVPYEETDVLADLLVTEKEILYPGDGQ